ncbi:ABC transporter, ATP-binding protein SagG, partial [Listeria ivanovii FSL F6-596]
MTEIAIKVTNLDVQIGKKQILSNMSLEIKKGEIFGLIGPSGAGKTTLVKTIIGMEKATTGQTEVLNKVMPSLPVISKIGYMAQSDALYTDLTAKENLD